MTQETDFVSTLGVAFLAHRLRRLVDHFLGGYGHWLPEANVTVPPRALSLVLLLESVDGLGVVEVAARLRLSHPLVIRLVRELESDGVLTATRDPADARRRVLGLTSHGQDQAGRIHEAVESMAQAYRELFDETGFDMLEAARGLEEANAALPFRDRLNRIRTRRNREEDYP